MNRRNFLRSASGLLVASIALAVPERRVFALDQTMIPGPIVDVRTGLRSVDVASGCVLINGQEYPIAQDVYTPMLDGIEKYDLIRVNGLFGYWYGEDKLVRGWRIEAIPPDAEVISWREAFARSPIDDRPLTLDELSQAMRDVWESVGR